MFSDWFCSGYTVYIVKQCSFGLVIIKVLIVMIMTNYLSVTAISCDNKIKFLQWPRRAIHNEQFQTSQ